MSVFKKIKSIIKNGLTPIEQGLINYNKNDLNTELKAKKRADICYNCNEYKNEPISFLKVNDKKIKKLEGKICGDCSCALPLLLRQNLKICKYWNENTTT